MKNVQKLILATTMLAAQLAFGTESTEQAYVESYQGRTDMPVPISVVKPDVPPFHGGSTVIVDFVVDAAGAPQGVKVRDADGINRALARSVVTAVEQWRFKPLLRAGRAVATRVILPIQIVDDLDTRGMMVAK